MHNLPSIRLSFSTPFVKSFVGIYTYSFFLFNCYIFYALALRDYKDTPSPSVPNNFPRDIKFQWKENRSPYKTKNEKKRYIFDDTEEFSGANVPCLSVNSINRDSRVENRKRRTVDRNRTRAVFGSIWNSAGSIADPRLDSFAFRIRSGSFHF